jgi:hypothetical protein
MTTVLNTRVPCVDNSEALRQRLSSYGFTRAEIDDADRMPEALILATLSEQSCTASELTRARWFTDRGRRFLLAFERLRATGQIDFSGGFWHVVSVETAEPEPVKKQLQRSLF